MYDAWHVLAWSCVRICSNLVLSDRSFQQQQLANMYSLAFFFNRISMVGCCLQYHISYVRSCCTAAVVVGLCSCYIQLHMRCCGCSLLHRFPCRYEVAATTAEALPLCITTVVIAFFIVCFFPYQKSITTQEINIAVGNKWHFVQAINVCVWDTRVCMYINYTGRWRSSWLHI